MDFLLMILVGMTVGWLAGQFMPGKGFGMLGDIVSGMVGALVGGLLFEKAGIFPGSGLIGSLIVGTTSAIIFLYGVHFVRKA